MDTVLRIIAIVIELMLLAAISYALLKGVKLAALDLGVNVKYSRAVSLALFAVGLIVLVFFIAHLITFYPGGD
jgi:hypothetical protein